MRAAVRTALVLTEAALWTFVHIGPAGALAKQQGASAATLVNTSAATAQATLSNLGGATTSLSGLPRDTGALSQMGTAANATDPTAALGASAERNRATQAIDPSADWLKSAYAVQKDPLGTIPATGSGQQQCTTTTASVTTTTADGTYSCEAGQSVSDATSSCQQTLSVTATTTRDYACTSTYDQAARAWAPSPACQALAASSACTAVASTCQGPPAPYFRATACTTGVEWSTSRHSCAEPRAIVTGTRYAYRCTDRFDAGSQAWRTSSACAALSQASACTETYAGCTEDLPPTTLQCQSGADTTPAQAQCTQSWTVAVGTYDFYDGARVWSGTTWAPDGPETALMAAGGGVCQVIATNCAQPSGVPAQSSCTDGQTLTSGQASCSDGSLSVPSPYKVAYLMGTTRFTGYAGSVTRINPFLAAAFGADCQYGVYLPGQPAPVFNAGLAQMTAPGAQFAILCGHVLANPSALYLNLGSAGNTPGPFRYQLQASGAAPYQDLFPACAALNTATTTCRPGAFVNHVTTASCQTVTRLAACAPPAGMVETGQVCADPQCATTTHAYADPAGGCYDFTDKWQCTAPVNGAGAPTRTQPYLISQGWDAGCAGLAANSACSLASTTVTEGAGTRLMDGLEVTAQAWRQLQTYSCAASHPVDTCSGADAGCELQSQACAQARADGTCALYAYVYSCPSHQCAAQTHSYQCTQEIAAADPYQSSTPYLISDAYDPGPCAALDSNSACQLTGARFDAEAIRTINGLALDEPNWTQTRDYVCQDSQAVDGCTGQVDGCTFVSRSCLGNDPKGACSVWSNAYRCPADDGSGGCGKSTTAYACSADVPGADPADKVTTTVTSAVWTPNPCPQAGDSLCRANGPPTCTDANTTRTIGGGQVTQACWSQTTAYTCETLGAQTSTCKPPQGCTLKASQCLDDGAPAGGVCINTEYDYACPSTSTTTRTASTCAAQMCVGAQCFGLSGASDSGQLGQAYAAAATAQEAGASFAASRQIEIMPGTVMGCHKALTGFSNCCSDAGWGLDIGLASCSAGEKQLIAAQTNKACHYVGTYCSDKSLFGLCLQKTMHYCCFQGALPRIINEAGRPQIAKGWGSAKDPDCSGFTVAAFQTLDLSKVDFSDFEATTLGALTNPASSPVVSQITQTLSGLAATGAPAPPVTPVPPNATAPPNAPAPSSVPAAPMPHHP